MAKKKFDTWEFLHIVDLIDKDPYRANEEFEMYLHNHPKDYYAYAYYASTFIVIGEFDKAEEVLEHVKELISFDYRYQSKEDRVYECEKTMLFTRLKLLAYKEKYNKLYEEYMKNMRLLKDMSINEVLFISRVKTGRFNMTREKVNGYIFKQMFEYSEEEFLEHIKKHMAQYNVELDFKDHNGAIFDFDFPLKKVIEEAKKTMLSDKMLYCGFVDNTYVYKYDCCGRVDGKVVDYFKVVCLHGTKNIITMYPIKKDHNLPCVDLNYLKENAKEIKLTSQIDKFNQRYAKRKIKK